MKIRGLVLIAVEEEVTPPFTMEEYQLFCDFSFMKTEELHDRIQGWLDDFNFSDKAKIAESLVGERSHFDEYEIHE